MVNTKIKHINNYEIKIYFVYMYKVHTCISLACSIVGFKQSILCPGLTDRAIPVTEIKIIHFYLNVELDYVISKIQVLKHIRLI